MKTITEFHGILFKTAGETLSKIEAEQTAAVPEALKAEGKTEEEIAAAAPEAIKAAIEAKVSEALKLEGDKLKHFRNAMEFIKTKRGGSLKRVIVIALGEGEKAPKDAVSFGESMFVIEYHPEPAGSANRGRRDGRRDGRDGGGRGDRKGKRRGRGGRDGERGPRGERGEGRGFGGGRGPRPEGQAAEGAPAGEGGEGSGDPRRRRRRRPPRGPRPEGQASQASATPSVPGERKVIQPVIRPKSDAPAPSAPAADTSTAPSGDSA